MLNQTIIVGRLTSDPIVKELEDGKKVSNITIAVPRHYKNEDGEYETDFIPCTLWQNIAENTSEYCHKGDIVGIKGRIEPFSNFNEEKKNNIRIIAEKVTFLSSSKKDEEEN